MLGVPPHGSGSSKGQAGEYFTSLISDSGTSLPLVSLRTGYAYVSAGLARSQGIKTGDDLFARINGVSTYVRTAGIALDGQLLNADQGIIMALSDVQQQLGLPGQVSSVLVTYAAPSGSQLAAVRAAIAGQVSAIPSGRVTQTNWQAPIAVTVYKSGDGNRLLAAGGVLLVLIGTIGMVILGRKPKPVRGRGHA